MEVDFLNLLVNSFTSLILFAGTTVAILQLRALRKQIKAQHEWNRRVTALDYTFSKDPMMREIRHRLEMALNLSSRGSAAGVLPFNP